MKNHKKIYSAIINALDGAPLKRDELVKRAMSTLCGTGATGACEIGKRTEVRGSVGSVINEMEANGVIRLLASGGYELVPKKPAALRLESCERELLSLLENKPMAKPEIREALVERFGTKNTATTRDDGILYSLIGQVIKRLTDLHVIELNGSKYRIAPEKLARIDDINEIIELKSEFLTRLHVKGGEFFEHYIVTLLSRYLTKHGKTVTEGYVTGGTEDGGIDGIIKTTDALGFREVLMIQSKNRLVETKETDVRGFWGAVCAKQGSRGIFATTASFHPTAAKFLEGIDNCVGVDADKIFKMARECLYGIKKRDGKYFVDTNMI